MTAQESFKKRIRARMAETGEKYGAARRSLIERATRGDGRVWMSDPDVDDASVANATGRAWDEWCDLIEASRVADAGHTAIAKWVGEEHGLNGWWSQQVTGGYERITGIRVPGQMADGTFQVGRSKTMPGDPDELRAMLLDDVDRDDLFGGHPTELRSRPTSKAVRISMGEGVALIGITSKADGRMTVAVTHERLPDAPAVEQWRAWWSAWLEALAELSD
ncbi:MAG: hypothetical protein AAGD18_20905 [Actinomycetota bacterium]